MFTATRESNTQLFTRLNPLPQPSVPTLDSLPVEYGFDSRYRQVAMSTTNLSRVAFQAAPRLGLTSDQLNPSLVHDAVARAAAMENNLAAINARATRFIVEEVKLAAESHAAYLNSLGPELRRGGDLRAGKIPQRSQVLTKKTQLAPVDRVGIDIY